MACTELAQASSSKAHKSSHINDLPRRVIDWNGSAGSNMHREHTSDARRKTHQVWI
jgi:hypothetical protein